jgi:Family of unknown function (DUF6507)
MVTAANNCESQLVGGAIAAFVQHHRNTLPSIMWRARNSLKGAVEATNAYNDGDLEMARQAQRNAVQAPPPDAYRRTSPPGSDGND